jgi:hypothetical protein
MGLEKGSERIPVTGTADRTTHGIDFHFQAPQTKPPEYFQGEVDHLDVNVRVLESYRLEVQLPELPVTTFLRTFITEHGTRAPEFHRLLLLRHSVFQIGTHHGSRQFRPEGDTPASPVSEGVHFLFHHIRRLSHAPGEKLRMFKNRQMYLSITEITGHFIADPEDVCPFPGFFG